MKFLSAIVLTALLAFAVGLYGNLPWWLFAVTSFIVAMAIHQRSGKAFLAGFTGMFLLWLVLAAIRDVANEQLLSSKVAQVLPLGGSSVVLLLVTGLVGGLIGGLSALTGSYARGLRRGQ